MSGCFEKDRVEDTAISFEEQLSIVYPRGPSCFHLAVTEGNDDEEDSDESKELSLFRNSVQTMTNELYYPSDFDEVKKAFTIAVHKWKIKNSTGEGDDKMMTSTKNSTTIGRHFSLLDQLQGGFAMPISLEEIQEASSSEERLAVFQKIIYLEDLQMDWNQIRPLLANDLSESFRVNPHLASRLINLHRKWFDQGRSSSEYTPLLYGICENLLETLAKAISVEESQAMQDASEISQSTVVVSLVQNWRDTWLDLMQRDQYSEDLAEEMEKRMFELFLRPGSCKVSLMAQKVLALIDPSTAWFQMWLNHVRTNDHLVSLLRSSESDTELLPELWMQVRTFGDTGERNVNNAPYQLYSIAMLSIALCRTRLSQFPWDAFTNSNSPEDLETTNRSNDSMNNIRTAIDEMLDLFLRVVAYICLDANINNDCSNADLKRTVLDGIEAILAGSHNDNSEVNRRYKKVKSRLQEQDIASDKVLDRFLKIQLNQ
jgi:hypothetical protein